MAPSQGDVAYACVSLLVDELARARLAGACLAPGSRSAPIALALARHPDVNLHVLLDERSAGFFALGLAKAARRPAAVACTSGTAAANLLPAVVEAAHARVPLVVLTADRPPELRATGANQTIDQIKIFGDYVRTFVEAGTPETRAGAARYWRSLGARIAAQAAGPPAGPVHVNLAFREPLVPTGAAVELGPDASGRADGVPWERVSTPLLVPSERDVEDLAALIGASDRGAIVAGALDHGSGSVLELAERAGWPVIAEPASGLRRPGVLAAAQHLLSDEDFATAHRPQVVLQFGATPTSRNALAFVASADELVVVDPDGLMPDPARHAARSIRADPRALARGVLERLGAERVSPWLGEWREMDRRARAASDELLDSLEEPFEGRVARDLHALLPPTAILVVASSMPVRDLDAFAAPRDGVRVLQNRGASGIDGLISTALGIEATGVPTCVLTGDLSLLHDAGVLLWRARRARRAVIVVMDNNGGGIFDFLPQSTLPEHEDLFVTPHELDLAAVARAAGARHTRITRASDLSPRIALDIQEEGLVIAEVPIDRALARVHRGAVRAAVHEAISTTAASRSVTS